MSDFYRELAPLLANSLDNFWPHNFDYGIRNKWTGGRHKAAVLYERIARLTSKPLGRGRRAIVVGANKYIAGHLPRLAETYDLLDDAESRRKFVELVAFKLLGFTKVKLSLNNAEFWRGRAELEKLRRGQTLPVQNFRGRHLNLYDLSDVGYDLKLFFVENGIYLDFILQQYNYDDKVAVQKGDVVIDAGACWGDTSLYFAHRGAGRVFSYEFIPTNIQTFNKNMDLNPKYAERITLIEKPVWESSGTALSYLDKGPASRVGDVSLYPGRTETLSIDGLAEGQGLERVDFIKMDIEGAELPALKGASETIRKFKPKLAISIYHKDDDFVTIPAYIRSLNPDYRFYLDYYTIIGDEIMLYAIDDTGHGDESNAAAVGH